MLQRPQGLVILTAFAVLGFPLAADDAKAGKSEPVRVESAGDKSAVLWKEPTDIHSRNLFYGPGGEQHQPHGPFKFVEEDLNGTNPKYVLRDQNKVKWTAKLGMEARPETVASRLVWAVGYSTNEDYFLQDVQVDDMPAHVKRGGKLIGADGSLHAVRLKRHLEDQKKTENWMWRDDPFSGTRELNGLKVMMALINNWDLKDENNEVYSQRDGAGPVYVVSDLGASFGTTGLAFPFSRSKGNLTSYTHSKFITKISPEFVDFRTPSRPSFFYLFDLRRFISRVHLDGVAHNIPREDARWIGQLLANLSSNQIEDAFRAAGYTQEEVDAFSKVIQARIGELNQL